MPAHQVRSYGPVVNTGHHSTDPATSVPAVGHARVCRYRIQVRGHLEGRLHAFFDGLELTDQPDGTTVIVGPVVDQAALHGLLERLRDLGIPLVSLTEDPASGPDPTFRNGSIEPPGATP
jgi:hypothetical protein